MGSAARQQCIECLGYSSQLRCRPVTAPLRRSGGVELLFGNQKRVQANIPQNGGQVGTFKGKCVLVVLHSSLLIGLVQLTVAEAMAWARDNLLTERPELFMKGSSV